MTRGAAVVVHCRPKRCQLLRVIVSQSNGKLLQLCGVSNVSPGLSLTHKLFYLSHLAKLTDFLLITVSLPGSCLVTALCKRRYQP